MIVAALSCIALVTVLLLGLALPLTRRLALSASEGLVATLVLSLALTWLFGWGVYVTGAPWALSLLPVALAAAGLCLGRRTLTAWACDPEARTLALGQICVSAGVLAWLPCIVSYSGAGWASDWFEHWERTLFFLARQPLDHRFLGSYLLVARPPLENIVCAVLLSAGPGPDFARYQIFMAVLSSLAFLPAGLLARRWGGPRAPTVLAALLLANPLFVENATFPWTKLPAAFLVLSGLVFGLEFAFPGPGSARGAPGPRNRTRPLLAPLAGTAMAAGLLTHYSAAPSLVVMAALWLGLILGRRGAPGLVRPTVLAACAAALVLVPWFAWAAKTFGPRALATSTSSVTQMHAWKGSQAVRIALNLRDTLVPPFLRTFDRGLIAQASPWAALRDQFFIHYQLNLFLAFGSAGCAVLLRECLRASRRPAGTGEGSRRAALLWAAGLGGTVVIGVAVQGDRSPWGLTHICLQPVVLVGLSFLASRWDGLGRGWRLALLAGCAFDFLAGIALQMGLQAFAPERWTPAGMPADPAVLMAPYSWPSQANYYGKLTHGLVFVADRIGLPLGLELALPVLILLLALALARTRACAGAPPSAPDPDSHP